ncbi:MAG: tetratricopeptide repeat protein [Gammaproteobacteria bacterium]|nr:tetratricopeptide repeat protein [Gammaproteobacteria bacterium]MBU1555116.1 tetratricopeptide repeat protein [Gammaproteobacteria bacterium]MBU2069510.1 tetratricopeptide repeat protein [Gammaproteobacteria bacterium]MBU2183014.1 tetratricopeptide repeat protein [Gammaproteobacteria bacterium]MBU2206659.1 tetratricopeptide repeat protein [Gammaproteobacteria bacterium]
MDAIALTDLVKKLGYRNHGALANKIRDILKDKEDFAKYLLKTDKVYGRDEKVQVSAEAEILVDNLAILAPYVKLFGVAESKEQYTPISYLANPNKRVKIRKDMHKFENKIRADIKRSNETLSLFPKFVRSILNAGELDIAKDSLRTLIEHTSESETLVDLSNSFESALWNEIVELQGLIESGKESSLSHQKLGENLFKMGEFDSAIEHLERAVELDPKNGTAYTIMALIYQVLSEQAGKALNGAMARNDLSGFIEHPIDAEEYWINERIEFGINDYQQLRERFIFNVIHGLYHWPEHDYKWDSRKNYLYNLKQTLKSELDTVREDLMIPFLKHVCYSDFEKWPELISIIMTWQYSSRDGDWSPNTLKHNNQQKCQVMALTSWFSEEGAKQLLEYEIKFVSRCETISNEAYELFGIDIFRSLYSQYFGRAEYEKFISEMLVKFQNQLLINNLEMIAQDRYLSITDYLYKLGKHHEYKDYEDQRWESSQKMYVLTDKQIHELSSQMKEGLKGWQNLLEHKAWQQFGSTNSAPSNMCLLIVTACLVELSQDINSDANITILKDFLQTEHNLRKSIGDINYPMSLDLVAKIKTCCTVKDKEGLNDLLNQYSALIEQIEEQRAAEDIWA